MSLFRLIHVSVYCVIILLGLLGNGIVLTAVYRRPSLHCQYYYLIASMAASDILLSILVTSSVAISMASDKWVFHPNYCTFVAGVTNSLCACTIFHLTVISFDRYMAIITPFKYNPHPSKGKLVGMFLLLWVFPFIAGFMPSTGWGEYAYWPSMYCCIVNFAGTTPLLLSYTMFLLCSCFVVPFVVMGYCHWEIFTVARRHARQIRQIETAIHQQHVSTGGTSMSSTTARKRNGTGNIFDLKPAKLSIAVVGMFLFCYLPFWTVILLHLAMPQLNTLETLLPIFFTLPLSNSACNPAVYCYKNTEFREEVLRFIGKRCSVLFPGEQTRGENRHSANRVGGSLAPSSDNTLVPSFILPGEIVSPTELLEEIETSQLEETQIQH